MSVVAKFRCESKTKGSAEDTNEIVLRAVYDPNPNSENGRFFKLTPAGSIMLSTVNPEAAKQFSIGNEYYVTFDEVRVGQPA